MTPVKYDGSNWVVTTEDDPDWYNYDSSENRWANAVIGTTYNVGDVVDESEADFYVWIPRFTYDPSSTNIDFVTGNEPDEMVHPAFSRHIYSVPVINGVLETNGQERDVELTGFWMSKHRVSSKDSLRIARKEGDVYKVTIQQGYMQYLVNSYLDEEIIALANENYDIHMQTMREYGAVAYLASYAVGGGIPSGGMASENENLGEISCNENETGVFDLTTEMGQLVFALWADTEYSFNDPTWNLGAIDATGLGIGVADNSNRNKTEGDRTILSAGYDNGLGMWADDIPKQYDQVLVMGVGGEMFNTGKIDLETERSFHSSIIKKE